MSEKPLVSVIIPTYNRALCIERSINSVLQQTYDNLEIIVVDDGSTDNTEQVVAQIEDTRIAYYPMKNNMGANAARNKGIELASGEYLAFQDSDDEWHPRKLEMQMKCMLEASDDVGLVYCAMDIIEDTSQHRFPNPEYSLSDLEENIADTLAKGNAISTQTILMRRECFQKTGMFDEEMPRLQDYEFVLRVIAEYKVKFVNSVLVKRYVSKNSISKNILALSKAVEYLVEKYFDFFMNRQTHHIFMKTCMYNLLMNGVNEEYFWQFAGRCVSKEKDILQEVINGLYACAYEMGMDLKNVRTYMNYLERKMSTEWKLQKQLILSRIQNNENYMIYGAGKLAKETVGYLCEEKQSHMPVVFLVSHSEGNPSYMDGVGIMAIDDVQDSMCQTMVLVCVDESHFTDIGERLIRRGFTNIYYVGNNSWQED